MKLIIAKPGFNALTETDPDNLIFSSDYNTLKYYTSGSYTMSGITTTTNVTIAHNLGYTPFFVCFVNDPVNNPSKYAIVEYENLFGTFVALRAYVDSTYLYLSANVSVSTPITVVWYYKIFKNNLGL